MYIYIYIYMQKGQTWLLGVLEVTLWSENTT
jgi:hypothetical protein